MRSLLPAVPGLALALAGPAVVAFASSRAASAEHAVVVHVLSLASIMVIVLCHSSIRVRSVCVERHVAPEPVAFATVLLRKLEYHAARQGRRVGDARYAHEVRRCLEAWRLPGIQDG